MDKVKEYRNYFLYLLILVGCFSLGLLFQERAPFEDGSYGNFTLSIIEDGDFNIINQIKDPAKNWVSTVTGNHSNYEHPAVSAYLFPFFLYQKILNLISVHNSTSLTSGYNEAHILSTIFYVLLGLLFLRKVFDELGIKHSRSSILVYALSTPFIWFTFFSSSTSNIFSLAFSIFVLSWFCFNRDKFSKFSYFSLGIILALGIAIRIQQFWIGGLLIYLLVQDPSRSFRKVMLFLAGSIIPGSFFLLNLYIRSEQILHPTRVYTAWTNFGEFALHTLPYALWGPNGYFTLSPIYVLILGFGSWLLIRKWALRKFYFFLVIPPTLLFLSYSSQWPLMDSLAGRHQLDYFFLYAMVLGLALDALKGIGLKLTWFAIFLAILWNIRSHIAFSFVDHTDWTQWQFYYHVGLENFSQQFFSFLGHINSIEVLYSVLLYLPLLMLLSLLLYKAAKLEKIAISVTNWGIILWGVFFFGAFTLMNLVFNPKNVEKYRAEGVYSNKVIAKGDAMNFYDDFTETYHKALRWHVEKGNCEAVKRLMEIRREFVKTIKTEVIHDPIGFVDDLNNNIFKRSYMEGQDLNKIQRDIKSICHL